MQTPHNSPQRDRLIHRVEYEEIAYWKDQVAWMGLMLWNMRHREPLAQPPPPPPPPPLVPREPIPATSVDPRSTPVVGSFSAQLPPLQRTVRYAYPERQYVD